MSDLEVELPQLGELHWGAKLNEALSAIVNRVNENTAASGTTIGAAVEAYLLAHPISAAEPLLAAHLEDDTPHPVYDNMPSLTLVYENGLI